MSSLNNHGRMTISLLPIAFALVSPFSFAIEPSSIEAGPINIIPTIDVDISHTDNLFRSNANEVSSNLWIVSPRLEAIIADGGNIFSLAGEVNEGNYSATDEDDYTDWLIDATARLQIDDRSILNLGASLFDTREMRGSGFSQGGFLPTAPDAYDETKLNGSYEFGTRDSFGRLVLSADSFDKSYSNNRVTTVFRDREDLNWSGTFYYNISPRTDILVEYSASDIDYVTDPTAIIGSGDTLDSTETYTYIGMTWDATAKTSGTFKVGYGEKDFDDSDRTDADGAAWELSLNWQPLSYSTFNLATSSGFDESTGVGNALDSTQYSLSWQHNWSDALSTTVSANSSDDDYTSSTRSDDINSFSFKLNYAVDRWLDVYFSVSSDDKESSINTYNYDQSVTAIGFSASL